jgi:hypothetical protein
MRVQAKCQPGMRVLHDALGQQWQKKPDVRRLKEALADLLVATGDGEQTTLLQRQLAAKLIQEGFLKAARELMPRGENTRDLKVPGYPIELSPNQAKGNVPGPSQSVPIPEGPAPGVRPSPRESPLADLPPWDISLKPASSERRPRSWLKTQLANQLVIHRNDLQTKLDLLRTMSHDAHRAEEARNHSDYAESPLAAVEERLDRKLTAAERILVLQMSRQAKNPPEIAAILRKLQAPQ